MSRPNSIKLFNGIEVVDIPISVGANGDSIPFRDKDGNSFFNNQYTKEELEGFLLELLMITFAGQPEAFAVRMWSGSEFDNFVVPGFKRVNLTNNDVPIWNTALDKFVLVNSSTFGGAGPDLSDYVTNDDLSTALADYVLTSVLSGYVTTGALTTALSGYPTDAELTSALGNYVLTSALTTALGDYVLTTALTTALDDYILSSLIDQPNGVAGLNASGNLVAIPLATDGVGANIDSRVLALGEFSINPNGLLKVGDGTSRNDNLASFSTKTLRRASIRRTSFLTATGASATFNAHGEAAPTQPNVTGTAVQGTGTTPPCIKWTSTDDSENGFLTAKNKPAGKNLSVSGALHINAITDIAIGFGFSSNTFGIVGDADTAANAGHAYFFRFSTAVSSDLKWKAVTSDSSNLTVVDTNVTPTTGWNTFEIICDDVVGNVKFYINNVLVATITTTRPTAGTLMNVFGLQSIPSATAGRFFEVSQMILEQDAA